MASLEETAAVVDPCIAAVCSNLAGIHAALRRVHAEAHTTDDIRRYQQVFSNPRPCFYGSALACLSQFAVQITPAASGIQQPSDVTTTNEVCGRRTTCEQAGARTWSDLI